jgi:Na+/proline symporter
VSAAPTTSPRQGGGYGPFLLALAFASTAASGATFLGLPGLTYSYGMSTLWIAFCYPVGVYIGILICQRTIGRYGNLAGARSIPEYLGERYQSEALRDLGGHFLADPAVLSRWPAGRRPRDVRDDARPAAGWALGITAVVLLVYVTLGGAHADILTDGAQGLLMIALAIAIGAIFFLGVGTEGFSNLIGNSAARIPSC